MDLRFQFHPAPVLPHRRILNFGLIRVLFSCLDEPTKFAFAARSIAFVGQSDNHSYCRLESLKSRLIAATHSSASATISSCPVAIIITDLSA